MYSTQRLSQNPFKMLFLRLFFLFLMLAVVQPKTSLGSLASSPWPGEWAHIHGSTRSNGRVASRLPDAADGVVDTYRVTVNPPWNRTGLARFSTEGAVTVPNRFGWIEVRGADGSSIYWIRSAGMSASRCPTLPTAPVLSLISARLVSGEVTTGESNGHAVVDAPAVVNVAIKL
jgi:hypothetical protein